MHRRPLVVVLLPLVLAAAGCLDIFGREAPRPSYADLGWDGDDTTGLSKGEWPSLDGVTLTVLDLGWPAFNQTAQAFEGLTGATVVRETVAGETAALERLRAPGAGAAVDVVIGLDQAFASVAAHNGTLEPYTPLLADRVDPLADLFGDRPWPGTPFTHDYIAFQWDPTSETLNETVQDRGVPGVDPEGPQDLVRNVFDVREMANLTVLADPVSDPVGRGILLMTVDFFGEDPAYYHWQRFWGDLLGANVAADQLVRCATIVPSQADALDAFSATGEGPSPVSAGYVTMPARLAEEEGAAPDDLPRLVLPDRQSWHRVEYSVIVADTPELAAAQAWNEFLLTEQVQDRIVEETGAYPAAQGTDLGVLGEQAPAPGSFRPAFIDPQVLGLRLEAWMKDWTGLRETLPECP